MYREDRGTPPPKKKARVSAPSKGDTKSAKDLGRAKAPKAVREQRKAADAIYKSLPVSQRKVQSKTKAPGPVADRIRDTHRSRQAGRKALDFFIETGGDASKVKTKRQVELFQSGARQAERQIQRAAKDVARGGAGVVGDFVSRGPEIKTKRQRNLIPFTNVDEYIQDKLGAEYEPGKSLVGRGADKLGKTVPGSIRLPEGAETKPSRAIEAGAEKLTDYQQKVAKGTTDATLKALELSTRGGAAIAGGTKAAIDGKNVIKGATESFKTGSTHFDDVFRELGLPEWAALSLGFVGDVATDPITYLTVGTGSAASKAIRAEQRRNAMELAKAAKPLQKQFKAGRLTLAEVNERMAPILAASKKRHEDNLAAIEAKNLSTTRGVEVGFRSPVKGSKKTVVVRSPQANAVGKKIAEKTPDSVRRTVGNVKPDLRRPGITPTDWEALRRGLFQSRGMASKVRRETRGLVRYLNRALGDDIEKHTLVRNAIEKGKVDELPADLREAAVRSQKFTEDYADLYEEIVGKSIRLVPDDVGRIIVEVGEELTPGIFDNVIAAVVGKGGLSSRQAAKDKESLQRKIAEQKDPGAKAGAKEQEGRVLAAQEQGEVADQMLQELDEAIGDLEMDQILGGVNNKKKLDVLHRQRQNLVDEVDAAPPPGAYPAAVKRTKEAKAWDDSEIERLTGAVEKLVDEGADAAIATRRLEELIESTPEIFSRNAELAAILKELRTGVKKATARPEARATALKELKALNKALKRADPNVPVPRFREVDAKAFHSAFAKALKDRDAGPFLSPYSIEDFQKMRTFLAHNGKVGGALKPRDDGGFEIVSLFNLGGPKGSGLAMMKNLLDNGATHLDCFGPTLPELYRKMGFRTTETVKFSRQYADPRWNYGKYGEPDLHFMEYDGPRADTGATEGSLGAAASGSRGGLGGRGTGDVGEAIGYVPRIPAAYREGDPEGALISGAAERSRTKQRFEKQRQNREAIDDLADDSWYEKDLRKVYTVYGSAAAKRIGGQMFWNQVVARAGQHLTPENFDDAILDGRTLWEVRKGGLPQKAKFPATREIFETAPESRFFLINDGASDWLERTALTPRNEDLRHIDKAFNSYVRLFKTANTLVRPGFFGTTMIGNSWQMFLADMSPRDWAQSFGLFRSLRATDKELSGDPRFLGRAIDKMLGADRKLYLIDGEFKTFGDLYEEAIRAGVIRSGTRLGDPTDFSPEEAVERSIGNATKKVAKPLKGTVTKSVDWAGEMAENLDDMTKLAIYIRGRSKLGYNVDDARAAAYSLMIDYSDLTAAERMWMKKLMPFYVYTSRNLPIQVRAVLRRPGKIASFGKLQNSLVEASGLEPGWQEKLTEPEQEGMPLPVPGLKYDGFQAFVNARLPVGDLSRILQVGEGSEGLGRVAERYVNDLLPLFKFGVERLTGNTLDYKRPVDIPGRPPAMGLLTNLLDQLPGVDVSEGTFTDLRTGKTYEGTDPWVDRAIRSLGGSYGSLGQNLNPSPRKVLEGLSGLSPSTAFNDRTRDRGGIPPAIRSLASTGIGVGVSAPDPAWAVFAAANREYEKVSEELARERNSPRRDSPRQLLLENRLDQIKSLQALTKLQLGYQDAKDKERDHRKRQQTILDDIFQFDEGDLKIRSIDRKIQKKLDAIP